MTEAEWLACTNPDPMLAPAPWSRPRPSRPRPLRAPGAGITVGLTPGPAAQPQQPAAQPTALRATPGAPKPAAAAPALGKGPDRPGVGVLLYQCDGQG